MKYILQAFKNCHKHGLIHRFLRPENILVRCSDFSDIRIINFPISLGFEGNKYLNEKFHYPHFIAPEVFDPNNPPTEKSDVWSCGAIIYFLLSGNVPFPGDTDNEIMEKVKTGKYNFDEKIWEFLGANTEDLISRMMTKDLNYRISID